MARNNQPLLSGIIAIAFLAGGPDVAKGDQTLSDFNNTGFDYTFSGFSQTLGPTSIRLNDTVNGWGGAGLNATLDLTPFSDGRFTIDLTENPGNSVDQFSIELFDAAGNSGSWSFSLSSLQSGVAGNLVSPTTLSHPINGNNPASLDLDQIVNWQVLGEWGSTVPFDLSFDKVAVSNTVERPAPYAGWEENAPWRAVAQTRIDAVRKADMQVRVFDAAGNTVPGAQVSLQMKRHEFGFGSAVHGYRLRDNQPQYNAYKQKVEELFNEVVIENNLKWPAWSGEWGGNFTQQGALDAAAWLTARDIDLRGHVLVWPSAGNSPQPIENLFAGAHLNAAQQQTLRDAITAHIADVAGAFDGIVKDWDVLNETRANHEYMDELSEGDLAMVDWFQAAATASPTAKRYINEYNILASSGGTDTANQQQYEDAIQVIKNNGGLIDGIGFQSHFGEGNLTGPEELWTILDRFGQQGLDMKITEFTFSTEDEQLQADFTRDFYTAMFAHEGIDSVLTWGFWEDAMYEPEAAMYRSDWSIKPNGQAFENLVLGEWWTDESIEADDDGEATVRGFKGEYEVTVTFGGKTTVVSATLTDGGLILDAVLTDLLSGDYNQDGTVDAADYTIWRNSLGQTVASGTGADGDGDGVITPGDFIVWRDRFGSQAVAVAVPEPSTLALLLIGGLALRSIF